MSRVWLSLGSNIDREQNIRSAVATLRSHLGSLVVSRVYESAAVGFDGEPFYNLVVGAETDRSIDDLVRLFREIESAQGRVRDGSPGLASRTLDIDLLTYGDRVVKSGRVELPRDEITRYAFVLLPLSEVAGDEIHPTSGKSYGRLWREFDARGQELWPIEFGWDSD